MKTIEAQKTFRHCIAYYLELTYLQYEGLRYYYFIEWCKQVAYYKHLPLKNLLSNDYLNNWFDDQWHYYVEKGIEKHYGKELIEGYFNAQEVLLMISLYVDDIFRLYPKTLLKLIANSEKAGSTRRQIHR